MNECKDTLLSVNVNVSLKIRCTEIFLLEKSARFGYNADMKIGPGKDISLRPQNKPQLTSAIG